VLDETTGKLVPPVPDQELVWDGLGAVMPYGRPAITQPVSGSAAFLDPLAVEPRPANRPDRPAGDRTAVVATIAIQGRASASTAVRSANWRGCERGAGRGGGWSPAGT
jgi:hypothetical protein